MDAHDPIDGYLRDLKRELRVRGRARRRILTEVRAHLLEAIAAESSRGVEEGLAAQRAVARFGLVPETAHQFNGVAGRRGAVVRRALVPWIAAGALTSTASATVWAFQVAPAPPRQAASHPGTGERCALEARAFPPLPTRSRDRRAFPPVPQTQALCGVDASGARPAR
jgi:hypothetical protein